MTAGPDPGRDSRRAAARYGTWAFTGTAESVPRARANVTALIDDPKLAWVAGLLVTELAANAIDHAGSAFRVTAVVTPARVRVGVEDGGRGAPLVRRDRDPTTPGGRGMLIVEKLSATWGYRVERQGKTVWFELFSGGGRGSVGRSRAKPRGLDDRAIVSAN